MPETMSKPKSLPELLKEFNEIFAGQVVVAALARGNKDKGFTIIGSIVEDGEETRREVESNKDLTFDPILASMGCQAMILKMVVDDANGQGPGKKLIDLKEADPNTYLRVQGEDQEGPYCYKVYKAERVLVEPQAP